LTTNQIQDFYTGNITRWNEAGGTNTEIYPYTREPNSGSQELMLSLVMKDLQMPASFINGFRHTMGKKSLREADTSLIINILHFDCLSASPGSSHMLF
jgi:ABC-type phosphate transport system substrate-binding protein